MFAFCCTNLEEKKRLVLAPARTAVKLLLGYSTGKIKSNPLEPHFETWATMSQSLEDTKTVVALPHCCSESTQDSPGGAFSDQRCGWSYGRMKECHVNMYEKSTKVEVLPVVDLCKKSAK